MYKKMIEIQYKGDMNARVFYIGIADQLVALIEDDGKVYYGANYFWYVGGKMEVDYVRWNKVLLRFEIGVAYKVGVWGGNVVSEIRAMKADKEKLSGLYEYLILQCDNLTPTEEYGYEEVLTSENNDIFIITQGKRYAGVCLRYELRKKAPCEFDTVLERSHVIVRCRRTLYLKCICHYTEKEPAEWLGELSTALCEFADILNPQAVLR
jgi:hypothetical protein